MKREITFGWVGGLLLGCAVAVVFPVGLIGGLVVGVVFTTGGMLIGGWMAAR